jgi:hypothetical protein
LVTLRLRHRVVLKPLSRIALAAIGALNGSATMLIARKELADAAGSAT